MNDNVIHLLKILEVALIAGVKFVFAPFEAERQGFNFGEALLISVAGGIFGIIAFTFIGDAIAYGWRKTVLFFEKPLHIQEKPKKKFTWMRKFIIRTKMKFGLYGLVITTPLILSIPIGTFMAHRFYRRKWRNIFLLMLSVIFWAVVINGIAQYLALSKIISK